MGTLGRLDPGATTSHLSLFAFLLLHRARLPATVSYETSALVENFLCWIHERWKLLLRKVSIPDPEKFSIQVLSLALTFQLEGLSLLWRSDQIICDASSPDARLS